MYEDLIKKLEKQEEINKKGKITEKKDYIRKQLNFLNFCAFYSLICFNFTVIAYYLKLLLDKKIFFYIF
jgi:hypothetical protein